MNDWKSKVTQKKKFWETSFWQDRIIIFKMLCIMPLVATIPAVTGYISGIIYPNYINAFMVGIKLPEESSNLEYWCMYWLAGIVLLVIAALIYIIIFILYNEILTGLAAKRSTYIPLTKDELDNLNIKSTAEYLEFLKKILKINKNDYLIKELDYTDILDIILTMLNEFRSDFVDESADESKGYTLSASKISSLLQEFHRFGFCLDLYCDYKLNEAEFLKSLAFIKENERISKDLFEACLR